MGVKPRRSLSGRNTPLMHALIGCDEYASRHPTLCIREIDDLHAGLKVLFLIRLDHIWTTRHTRVPNLIADLNHSESVRVHQISIQSRGTLNTLLDLKRCGWKKSADRA